MDRATCQAGKAREGQVKKFAFDAAEKKTKRQAQKKKSPGPKQKFETMTLSSRIYCNGPS